MLDIKFIKFSISEKGLSLLFTMLILAVLLALALGVSTILLGQVRMLKGMEDSLQAFYAADTGVERVLYEDTMCRQPGCESRLECRVNRVNEENECLGLLAGDIDGSLINGASYETTFTEGATSVESLGIYRGARRAIEINRSF